MNSIPSLERKDLTGLQKGQQGQGCLARGCLRTPGYGSPEQRQRNGSSKALDRDRGKSEGEWELGQASVW